MDAVESKHDCVLLRVQVKSIPGVLEQIDALAFTDGMAWTPGGWTYKTILHESVPSDAELVAEADKQAEANQTEGSTEDIVQLRKSHLEGLRKIRDQRANFARLAPAAFAPPSTDVEAFVAKVGCNWVTSEEPLGTAVNLEDSCTPTVSAAHTSHPSTTFSARDDVFRFLDEAVRRAAGEASGGVNACHGIETDKSEYSRPLKKSKA